MCVKARGSKIIGNYLTVYSFWHRPQALESGMAFASLFSLPLGLANMAIFPHASSGAIMCTTYGEWTTFMLIIYVEYCEALTQGFICHLAFNLDQLIWLKVCFLTLNWYSDLNNQYIGVKKCMLIIYFESCGGLQIGQVCLLAFHWIPLMYSLIWHIE